MGTESLRASEPLRMEIDGRTTSRQGPSFPTTLPPPPHLVAPLTMTCISAGCSLALVTTFVREFPLTLPFSTGVL